MNQNQDPALAAYLKASAQSYDGGLVQLTRPILDGWPIIFAIGFQPMGICSLGGNHFAVVDYFAPAIYFGRVEKQDQAFSLIEEGTIRGVMYGQTSHRIFPPTDPPGGTVRGQAITLGPGGTLIANNNAGRNFVVIAPPLDGTGTKWRHLASFTLPDQGDGIYRFVHSVYFKINQNVLITTESTGEPEKPWQICCYSIDDLEHSPRPTLIGSTDSELSHIYGITLEQDVNCYVTDSRSNGPYGIYRNTQRIIPGITGNGLCFLEAGGILVSEYGQEKRQETTEGPKRLAFGGQVGTITYLPPLI